MPCFSVLELMTTAPKKRKRGRMRRKEAESQAYHMSRCGACLKDTAEYAMEQEAYMAINKNKEDRKSMRVGCFRQERKGIKLTLERRMLFPLPRSPSIRTVFVPTGTWAFDSNSCLSRKPPQKIIFIYEHARAAMEYDSGAARRTVGRHVFR